MTAQGILRRWKRFLPAFTSIDATIEEFRDARDKLVQMLCNATDDAVAEKLRVVLDEMMIEALLTLELVPAMPKMLASTDLAQDVGALRNHQSERVHGLATGIVRGWRASVKDELFKASASMDKLSQVPEPDETDHHSKILQPSAPKKTANSSEPSFLKMQSAPSVVGGSRVTTGKIDPPPEKAPAAAVRSSHLRESVGSRYSDERAMNAAKRKLREGYHEADDAKRRLRVQVIEEPDRQRKMHPITRPRSQPSFAVSTAKRNSRLSSLRRV